MIPRSIAAVLMSVKRMFAVATPCAGIMQA